MAANQSMQGAAGSASRDGTQDASQALPQAESQTSTQATQSLAQEMTQTTSLGMTQSATQASAPIQPAGSQVLSVTHDTHYQYAARVESAQHQARLKPLTTQRQTLLSFALEVEPVAERVIEEVDAFGNARMTFALNQPHESLLVRSLSTVRVVPPTLSAGRVDASPDAITWPDTVKPSAWEAVRERFRYRAGVPYDPASEFVFASPYVACDAQLAAYAAQSFTPGRPLVQAAWDLMRRIHADFKYKPNTTDVSTTALDALAMRQGVCQDFAHVMIGAMRSLGLPARYVSGYLLTQPPPGKPRLIGADASHAWVEVYDPAWPEDNGWLQLDPTNDRAPGDDYVILSVGRDYEDVMPLRGVIRGGGADQVLTVAVTVLPGETPVEKSIAPVDEPLPELPPETPPVPPAGASQKP